MLQFLGLIAIGTALGFVLALIFWGVLTVLRPILDVFRRDARPAAPSANESENRLYEQMLTNKETIDWCEWQSFIHSADQATLQQTVLKAWSTPLTEYAKPYNILISQFSPDPFAKATFLNRAARVHFFDLELNLNVRLDDIYERTVQDAARLQKPYLEIQKRALKEFHQPMVGFSKHILSRLTSVPDTQIRKTRPNLGLHLPTP